MNAAKLTKILRYRAAEWLRYERRCPILCFERPPATWMAENQSGTLVSMAREIAEAP